MDSEFHNMGSKFSMRLVTQGRGIGEAGWWDKNKISYLQYLCAYLELDNVLGLYDYAFLEICRFPGYFSYNFQPIVLLQGTEGAL